MKTPSTVLLILTAITLSACDHSSQPKPETKPAAPKTESPPPAPTAPTAAPAPTAPTGPTAPTTPPAPKPKVEEVLKRTELPDSLIIEDLRFGDGAECHEHDIVKAHYRGTLADGKEFESSYTKNEPSTFSLDRVIKGWQEGLVGMKVGGKRRLIIPSELGYGSRTRRDAYGQVLIPPDSMLVFEIELLETKPVADK